MGTVRVVSPLFQRLKLPQVKMLALEDVTPSDALRLMGTSCHLTSFTLHRALLSTSIATATRLPLLALQSLEILDSYAFLDHIYVPGLTSLTVKSERSKENLGPYLQPLLEKSNPPLLSIDMDTVRMSPEDLVSCFEMLPGVETLRLQNCSVSDVVLEELAIPRLVGGQHAGWLLPQLKEISLLYNHFRSPALIKFLRCRDAALSADPVDGVLAPSSRIEGKVGFYNDRHLEEDDDEIIKSFGISIMRPIIR